MTILTASRFYSQTNDGLDLGSECAFFSSLKMPNGTFKFTHAARFEALESVIGAAVRERADGIRDVLDIGVSTGVTTVELADFLAREGIAAKIVATDLFVDAHLVKVGRRVRVLADPQGWPLQYDIAGRPVRAWVRRLDYVSQTWLARVAARRLLQPRLMRKIKKGQSRPVRMETRTLASRGIALVEDDVFVPCTAFLGRFDFIRAANVLNRGYFPDDRIERALANIRTYCRGPGALVLIVRSGGARHDGTLFELGADGGFHVRTRIGRGSEIESLVLSVGTAVPAVDTSG